MKANAVRFLGVLAWAWILWSLYPVVRYGIAVVLDPSTTSRIMGVRTGDRIHSAIGLTYTGIGGAALVIAEVLVVLLALWFSRSDRTPVRRASLAVLVAWTALWLGNSIWMERLSGGTHPSSTTLLAVALVVVTAWATLRWGGSGIEKPSE